MISFHAAEIHKGKMRQGCDSKVIRLSGPATLAEIGLGIETLIGGIQLGPVEGKLWLVERGMIREYQPPE